MTTNNDHWPEYASGRFNGSPRPEFLKDCIFVLDQTGYRLLNDTDESLVDCSDFVFAVVDKGVLSLLDSDGVALYG